MKAIDPTKIKNRDLPLIALSTLSSGIPQALIRWKTKSSYSHAMWMHKPGLFASQGNMFSIAPLHRYMKRNCRLKFWKIKDLSKKERDFLLYSISGQLNAPWHKRIYDWLGILGQTIGLKWLNQHWQFYCSERVANDLKGIVPGIDPKSSPEELNEAFKKSDRMEVYGRWVDD